MTGKQIAGILSVTVAALCTSMASASTLLLDLGTTTAYTGVNDPAHAEGTVGTSYTDWRAISTIDATTTTDSAGNVIGIDVGRSTSGAATNNNIDLDIGGAAVTSGAGTGIFSTTLTNDAMQDASGFFRDPIGVLISGLPAGKYYVYVIAHYGSHAALSSNVMADATSVTAAVAGVVEFPNAYNFAFQDTLEGANAASWQLGDNYARFTITLTNATPSLIVAVDEGNTTTHNSAIAGIIVTSIPEPAALALVGLGAFMLVSRRRRPA